MTREIIKIDQEKKTEISINEIEKIYITQKILGLPNRLTSRERAAAGESIIKKIWDEKIRGDYKTIHW